MKENTDFSAITERPCLPGCRAMRMVFVADCRTENVHLFYAKLSKSGNSVRWRSYGFEYGDMFECNVSNSTTSGEQFRY